MNTSKELELRSDKLFSRVIFNNNKKMACVQNVPLHMLHLNSNMWFILKEKGSYNLVWVSMKEWLSAIGWTWIILARVLLFLILLQVYVVVVYKLGQKLN